MFRSVVVWVNHCAVTSTDIRSVSKNQDLATLKRWWVCLEKFEKDMRHAEELQQKWKSFWWPAMQWCREVIIRLFENEFESVPADVIQKIKLFQHSFRISLPCEHGGGRLQIRARAHPSKRMSRVEKWHALLESPILNDFERSQVEPTPMAESCRPKRIDGKYFDCRGWKHSLEGDFDHLGREATWLATTHEHRMRCFLGWASFVELDGDWARHCALWRGMLAVDGHLLFDDDFLQGLMHLQNH